MVAPASGAEAGALLGAVTGRLGAVPGRVDAVPVPAGAAPVPAGAAGLASVVWPFREEKYSFQLGATEFGSWRYRSYISSRSHSLAPTSSARSRAASGCSWVADWLRLAPAAGDPVDDWSGLVATVAFFRCKLPRGPFSPRLSPPRLPKNADPDGRWYGPCCRPFPTAVPRGFSRSRRGPIRPAIRAAAGRPRTAPEGPAHRPPSAGCPAARRAPRAAGPRPGSRRSGRRAAASPRPRSAGPVPGPVRPGSGPADRRPGRRWPRRPGRRSPVG